MGSSLNYCTSSSDDYHVLTCACKMLMTPNFLLITPKVKYQNHSSKRPENKVYQMWWNSLQLAKC